MTRTRDPLAAGTCVALAAAICITLAAIAGCHSTPSADAPAAPRIWDVRAARSIDAAALARRVADARYRLLGEIHDNPAHHAARAELVAAVAATGARPAVALEQFDLPHDAALVAAQARGADAEALADAGQLARRSWRWPLHRRIVDAALAAGLPVRAANVANADVSRWARAGAAQLPDAPWRERLARAPWDERDTAALRQDIVESHCRMLPESAVPTLVLAQRIRDAAMAQAIVDAATADGAILIAGNGHVRRDLGVPRYLDVAGLPGSGAAVVSVGFVEVPPETLRDGADPMPIIDDNPGFDYLWLTEAVARPDPCEGMRRPEAPAARGAP